MLRIVALPVQVKHFGSDQPILIEDDQPAECCLLVEGFCARAKTTLKSPIFRV